MKCEYCNIYGVKHAGIFACVRDIKDRLKDYRDKLRTLEDLALKLYDHGAIRSRGMDDMFGDGLIRDLEKLLDLETKPYDITDGNDDISEDTSRLD